MDIREADLEQGQEWTGWHRIEKDLWPARAKGYEPLDAEERAEVRRRPAGQHQHAVREDPGPDLHRRPDRQRLARPAGRGGDRQGDRRGGVLVADRPVGLPGQRRRRPGRLRRAAAAAADAGRRAGHQIDAKFVALQSLLDAQRAGDGFKYLRPADRGRGQSSCPTRSTRCPSRCPSWPRRSSETRIEAWSVDADAAGADVDGRSPVGRSQERGLAPRASLGAGCSAPPGSAWPGRGRGGRRLRQRARRLRPAAAPYPGARRPTPSTATTRPASSPRRRTGCTSPRSTSPPTPATS